MYNGCIFFSAGQGLPQGGGQGLPREAAAQARPYGPRGPQLHSLEHPARPLSAAPAVLSKPAGRGPARQHRQQEQIIGKRGR